MKYFIKIILANLVIFFFIFFGLELIIRITYPQIQFPGTDSGLINENRFGDTRGLMENSEGKSQGVIKRVDEDGFWSYSQNQQSGKKVLFLGDSVTMGIGVESDSTFSGKLLAKGDGLSLYNPSLIGYSNIDYLNVVNGLFKGEAGSLFVDEVVIFWCLNDVYEGNSIQTPGFEGESMVASMVSFFRSHFKTFHLLKKLTTDRPKAYYLFDQQFYESNNTSFVSAVQNLSAIDSVLKASEVKIKVVVLPYEYQLRGDGDTKPQRLMKESLVRIGIPVYDPVDFLNGQDVDPEELYLFGDGIHFSNKGHELIARFISVEVLSN